MRAADTNVLVRLVTRDDAAQYARAIRFVERGDVLIPKSVLLETAWVLRYSYSLDAQAIAASLRALLGMRGATGEDEAAMLRAIGHMEKGLDFADALHLESSTTCTDIATFDKAFVKSAKRVAQGRVAALESGGAVFRRRAL